jgi:chaperonin GroES
MNVQPLHDFVAVKKDAAPAQTRSSIYMFETVEDKFVTGTVIGVGPGRVTSDGITLQLHVKVGDRIVFSKSIGIEVELNDDTFLLVRERQILCVLK